MESVIMKLLHAFYGVIFEVYIFNHSPPTTVIRFQNISTRGRHRF